MRRSTCTAHFYSRFHARFFASFLHIPPRRTQLFVHRLGDFVSIRWHGPLRRRQIAYDFPLALARNLAIAQKSSQNFLMSKVLPPCLELFGGFTEILAQSD